MFKVGDRVKCINASSVHPLFKKPPLVLGREYIIYNISECSCGAICLDVGFASELGQTHCHHCGNISHSLDETHWCSSKRFIKVQEKKEYIAVSSTVEVEEPVNN